MIKIWVVLIIFTLWNPRVLADQSHDVFTPISSSAQPNVIRHSFYSKSLQANRVVDVALPANYVETANDIRYPVILVMDGELLFRSVSGLVEIMSMTSQMPEAIVVGINNTPGDRRNMMPRTLNEDGHPHRYGGKEKEYLAFIKDEVLPMIDKTYRAASFRTMIGLSPSAKLTLHTFWKAPELFDAHVAINTGDFKAQGYQDESAFDKITQLVEKSTEFKGILYLSMGPYNLAEKLKEQQRLKKKFFSFPSSRMNFKTEIIDKSGYATALPSIISALEMIFPAEKWDVSYRKFFSEQPAQTLKAVKLHFDALSKEYGFTVLPKGERFYNRTRLKRLGYQLLEEGRSSEAIDMFKYWQVFYPYAANSHDSLADAYEANNQFDMALKSRIKAVQLAKRNKDARLVFFESALQTLKEKMKD